jgi:outer membrane autotransporter protein
MAASVLWALGLTIINNGTIMGGLSGDGVTRADAIIFTGGANFLTGTGTVGSFTMISGSTFAPGSGTPGNAAPGSSITVAGNLAFQSGASYLVQVNPTATSFATVTGTASLGGATVQAVFTGTGQPAKSYDILRALTGISGTFAPAVQTSNLPPGFTTSLSYTATDVFLNVTAKLGGPQQATGLSSNHLSVADAINNFFNDPPLPPAFLPLFSLTGGNLANALTLLSGEAATGAQQPAFQLTNQFLNIMLDPFVDGRSNVNGGGAIGFAPEREELADDVALAYAKILKAPPKPQTFDQPWSVWGAGYGGSNRTTGDLAAGGSHDLSASTAGGTAGLDYRLAPGTVVGFALAGGGTNWGLAQGLGGGKSDAFQAGVYGTARWGSAYLAAALSFTNNWMSTDRFAFAGDHLSASFNAQSYGGRVESGYRFATYYGGLTPYAAIQSQTFHTPGYIETDLNAGGFALGFNSRNATDTRSELGGRFDRLLLLNPEAALTMRARVAWAHDWVSDPTLTAAFQMLPGTSFIVNGATPAKNSALVSEGAELRLANGFTLLGKFDGEFASHSTTYAGTGTVRYTW